MLGFLPYACSLTLVANARLGLYAMDMLLCYACSQCTAWRLVGIGYAYMLGYMHVLAMQVV